jgi:hypothetical protein
MAQKAAKIESGMLGFHQSSFVVVPRSRFSRTSIWGQVKYQGSRRPNQLSTQSPYVPIKVAKHLTCPQEVFDLSPGSKPPWFTRLPKW